MQAQVATVLLLALFGVATSQEAPQCRPFQEIYASGKELCENMWGDAFKYEADEENAYTMWFFDHKNNPNNKISQNLAAKGIFELPSEQKCYLEYYHKGSDEHVNNNDHPIEEPDSFQECHPWSEESCCFQSTVDSVQKIKESYGPEWHWDRCGPLSQACERFFVQEACFYECEPNAGIYRRHKESSDHPDPFAGSQMLHEEGSEVTNAWEIYQMPIKASYCDAWWMACKNDLFCASDDGDFFSCAKQWKPLDLQKPAPPPGSCAGRCNTPNGKGQCGCDDGCEENDTCCTDKEDMCFPFWLEKKHGSCDGSCGHKAKNGNCFCDTACEKQKVPDCCEDRLDFCPTEIKPETIPIDTSGSCENACGKKVKTDSGKCYCDKKCSKQGDCCSDMEQHCTEEGEAKKKSPLDCGADDC